MPYYIIASPVEALKDKILTGKNVFLESYDFRTVTCFDKRNLSIGSELIITSKVRELFSNRENIGCGGLYDSQIWDDLRDYLKNSPEPLYPFWLFIGNEYDVPFGLNKYIYAEVAYMDDKPFRVNDLRYNNWYIASRHYSSRRAPFASAEAILDVIPKGNRMKLGRLIFKVNGIPGGGAGKFKIDIPTNLKINFNKHTFQRTFNFAYNHLKTMEENNEEIGRKITGILRRIRQIGFDEHAYDYWVNPGE